MGGEFKAFGLPAAGAAASTALAAWLTAGSPGQAETVVLCGVCAAARAILAGAAGLEIFGDGGDEGVFGKKAVSAEERFEQAGAVPNSDEAVREAVVPVKVAQDAAAALAGIKSLIESLEITDRQTWEKVAALAKGAEAALEEMQAQLVEARNAAGRAMEAFRGIAALVEGR